MKDDVMFFFCDDKVKVFVGNLGSFELIGVRGRQSIVFVIIECVVLDYDMIFVLLILSVVLYCFIFDDIEILFV